MVEQTETTAAPQPFDGFLAELRNGQLLSELADALAEVTAAVAEHRKAGDITLKLQIKPASKNTAGTVLVTDDVKVKAPVGDRPETVFFVTDDHQLSRRDPRQRSFDELREADAPSDPTPLREVK